MTEVEVRRIHTDAFYGALKTQDFEALDRIYSDSYMLVRPDGSVLNKRQVLEDLRDRGLTFQSIELEQVQVRVFGSAAILAGESRTLSSRDGKTTHAHFRLVAVYVEDDAGIRLEHLQSTNVSEPNQPGLSPSISSK